MAAAPTLLQLNEAFETEPEHEVDTVFIVGWAGAALAKGVFKKVIKKNKSKKRKSFFTNLSYPKIYNNASFILKI